MGELGASWCYFVRFTILLCSISLRALLGIISLCSKCVVYTKQTTGLLSDGGILDFNCIIAKVTKWQIQDFAGNIRGKIHADSQAWTNRG